MADRKVVAWRQFPSEKNCTLTITGEEEGALPVAVWHAVHNHGHRETPELREQIRQMMRNE